MSLKRFLYAPNIHQGGGKLGCAIDRAGLVVAFVLAHFDPDGFSVSSALVVSVLALLVCWKSLVDGMGIDREVPGEVAQ